MIHKEQFMNTRFILTSAALLTMSMGTLASACDGKKGSAGPEVIYSMAAVADPFDPIGSGEGSSFELQISNGKAEAKINGEDVPPDRIRVEQNRVVILDEHGDVLREIPMQIMGDGDSTMRIMIGDDDGVVTDDASAAARSLLGAINQRGVEFRQKARAMVDQMPRSSAFDFYATDAHGNPIGKAYTAAVSQPPPKVMIGVVLATPDEALAKHLRIDPGAVTMLSDVQDGLPAAKAGLEKYDVVIEINGESPASPNDIRDALKESNPGDTLKVTVLRGGEKKTVTIDLAAFDAEKMGAVTMSVDSPHVDVQGSLWAPRAAMPHGGFTTNPLKSPRGAVRIPLPPSGSGAPGAKAPAPSTDPIAPNATQDMVFIDPGQFFDAFAGHDDSAMNERLEQMDRRLEEMTHRLEELMARLEKRSN
jgi:hypothetical protein